MKTINRLHILKSERYFDASISNYDGSCYFIPLFKEQYKRGHCGSETVSRSQA